MGGAPARRRSPAARGAPPAYGACAVSAAAAPRHRPRGTGEPRPLRATVCSGSWGSSRGPLPSRLGGRAPSESPARRRRSRAARTSRLRGGRRPRAPLPPGLVSVWRRSPQARRLVRPSASRHAGAPLSRRGPGSPRPPVLLSLLSASSLRSPEPPGLSPSLPLPCPHSACSRDGQPLPLSSLVASFVCRLPPARPLWDLGQHHSLPWPLPGVQGPEGVRSSRVPLCRCGTSEAVPLVSG